MQILIEILQAILGIFKSNTQKPETRNNSDERHRERSREIYSSDNRSFKSEVSLNVQTNIRGSLIEAEQTRMKLDIAYTNKSGMTSTRVIEVHGIGREYIDAYDHRRNTFRTFRISRISVVNSGIGPFQRRSNYRRSKYLSWTW